MPRKSKTLSQSPIPSGSDADTPHPAQTEAGPSSAPFAGEPRDPQGRFAKNNSGGPGNPHARHCAHMLEMFRNAISDEEMFVLTRILFEKATTGDMSALKMVLQYKIGKPLPAPHPDRIDRDEWDHFQKDGTTIDEMKQALSRLPSHVGNTIVSEALPSIAATISRNLGEQLRQSVPEDYWSERACEAAQAAQNQPAASASSQCDVPATPEASPIPNRIVNPESTPDSVPRALQARRSASGSNGNSKHGSNESSPATAPRATVPNGNSKTKSTNVAGARSETGSNGNSRPGSKSGKGRNAHKKEWMATIAEKCKPQSKGKKQRVCA